MICRNCLSASYRIDKSAKPATEGTVLVELHCKTHQRVMFSIAKPKDGPLPQAEEYPEVNCGGHNVR